MDTRPAISSHYQSGNQGAQINILAPPFPKLHPGECWSCDFVFIGHCLVILPFIHPLAAQALALSGYSA